MPMKQLTARQCVTNLGVLILFLVLILSGSLNAAENKRPFWTEKSAFIEGKDLLVVGVASRAITEEEGRLKAFENGKVELMNYAQITDLEAQGLVIETQMTYEEANPDGTVTVFRLLQVPFDKLVAIQGRVKAQGEAREREIKKLQTDLMIKQKNLEAQTRLVDQKLKDLSALQFALSERAKQLDDQQEKVQALLFQLTGESPGKKSALASNPPVTQPVSIEVLESQIKEAEDRLDQREQAILKIQKKAMERITKNTQRVCKFVRAGMTEEEVRSMLGEPDGSSDVGHFWVYGNSTVHFDGVGLVGYVVDEDGNTCQGRRNRK